MANRSLDVGVKHSGIFIHSENESAPFVVGTLWLDENRGVIAEIPYISSASDQFETPTRWFRVRKPPANLVFRTEDLEISLFGCTFSRAMSGSHLNIGGLRAREAVLHERIGEIDDPLTISVLGSQMDGLADWTRLSSVSWGSEWIQDEHGGRRRLNYTIERQDGLTWYQGEARMTLTSHWGPNDDTRSGIHLDDVVVLLSKFRTPRPVADHLAEHRKFRDLLSLIYGTGAHFRKHEIRDRGFPFQTLDGKIHGAENHQVICAATIQDHYRPESSRNAHNFPILSISDVSSSTLSEWAMRYHDWRRLILPVAGVLRRSGLLVEEIVINTSMSIEAIGQKLGRMPNEQATYGSGANRPTTATYYYRTARAVGLDTSPISCPDAELSRALADIYNTIKHPDRGDFPNPIVTHFAGRIMLLLARLALMKLLLPDGAAVDRFVKSWTVRRVFEDMERNSVTVDASGRFVVVEP
ncbi:hypothetical protein AB0J90_01205 [Micromonospora sp. NPDC049523]|uniref:ApeA N-terminal domain 1-containing protein n=1 Tax=Micromonospora sp. NPDC049523 TaxID=3155921 RepID=UPI00342CA34F